MTPSPASWSRRALLRLALILPLAATPALAAQQWPDRPITVVVPSTAGGAADFVGRTFANFIARKMPGTVVTVENRAGAGGIVGTLAVQSAAPDGYTFLISTNSTHAANVSLYKNLRYDPVKDFEQVGMFGTFGSVLVVRNDSPYPDLPAFIAHARAHPGKLSYGYYSSSSQVPPELLRARMDLQYVGASYKSVTQILTDLIGGQLDFVFVDTLSAAPALQNDRLRPIAVTTAQPIASLPEVAPVARTVPGFLVQGWFGLAAPRGTPAPIVAKMAELVEQAGADPQVAQALSGRGLTVQSMSGDAFVSFIHEDIERWAQWTRVAGIQAQ
ncbi:tripartite tricarboxylate transporter substrate binding protein [Orrella sp. JC864]|uniref:Bug family tripartite tricarboxylate transporter substrate binding protein n=1 Tax=Orrella sp. JC864 TaxID=3120298 RepID=UPI00300B3554